MASYATQLTSSSNCGNDYTNQNPIVIQAYNGLISYDVVFQTTCLESSDSNYCFADAVTNSSSPTSSYVYYLPVGGNLAAGAMPTCNGCLKTTMHDFANYASNSTQPISATYPSAATMIDAVCGSSFAETNIKIVESDASSSSIQGASVWLLGTTVLFAAFV